MAACSQSRLNSKSCPEVVRRYGNSSLNATMIFDCALARTTGGVRVLLRCLSRKQFPLKRIWFYSASQRVNGIHELIDIVEALVNRRVTQVSDLIDLAQLFKHSHADHRRGNFASAGLEFVHDFVHHVLQRKQTGGTLFKSFGDAGSKFATVERLMRSVGFYHAQVRTLDLLIGRVAVFAF